MFWGNLWKRLTGRGTSSPTTTSSWHEKADQSDARAKALNIDPPREGRKTYSERYSETAKMSSDEIKSQIARREADGKGDRCGVLYRVLADREKSGESGYPSSTTTAGLSNRQIADRSDARAKALNIDPPREGRKTYSQRYNESSGSSSSDIRSQIASREAQGKETGVLRRILADRDE